MSEGGLAPRCEDCMAAQCSDAMGKCMANCRLQRTVRVCQLVRKQHDLP